MLQGANLMDISQAKLDGAASMLDGGDWGGACAAIMPRHLDDVCIGLGHTTGHGANASLSHQLHRDLAGWGSLHGKHWNFGPLTHGSSKACGMKLELLVVYSCQPDVSQLYSQLGRSIIAGER